MPITKPLTDDEALAKMTPTELGIGEVALAGGPIDLDLAYLHQHPRIVTIASLPDLGRNLDALKEDVRSLVLRRLGGHAHERLQLDA